MKIKPALKTVEEEWSGFANMVLSKECTQVQWEEMKKSFFAGYLSCFSALKLIGEPAIGEEEAEQFLTAREQEIFVYYRDLLNGWEAQQN